MEYPNFVGKTVTVYTLGGQMWKGEVQRMDEDLIQMKIQQGSIIVFTRTLTAIFEGDSE